MWGAVAKTIGSFSVSLTPREAKNARASSNMVVEQLGGLPVLRMGPGFPASDGNPGAGDLRNSTRPAWLPA